jgi:hypothetical protein
MEILDCMWFSGRTSVGIVKVKDEYEGVKYYIGSAMGIKEKDDMQHIADWGATFPKSAGDVLFGVN